MKKGKLFLILMCLAVIFFPACQGENTTPDTNGSIRVVINDSTGLSGGGEARGVEPQGLEVSKYEISGTGPVALGPVTLTKGQSAEHTFSPVTPGQWTITAKALATSNSIDYVVGESSQTITVTPGQTANAAITITEKTGKGTITFNILDESHALQSLKAAVSTGVDMANPVPEIDLTYNEESKKWVGSTEIEKGMYAVRIADDQNTVSTMDSVRIYAGITTVYSAEYKGGIIDVSITDQIVPTPDLELSVTPADSVASNGTITAVANVSNIVSPTYAWYVNGMKVEGETNELSYALDGQSFTSGQMIQVTVFVSQGSVIWSESHELSVTEAVTLPEEGSISINTNEMTFAEETPLTYTGGSFADNVTLKWSVNGEPVDGTTYTPDTIGKKASIVLTATLDGVSRDYESTVAINPVVNVSTTASQVPENAIIDVIADVRAPEGYALTITANGSDKEYQNGKIPLDGISTGNVSLGWKLTFNGEEWTGTSSYSSAVIMDSEATEAPAGSANVGGQTDEEKRTFINNLVNEIRSLAEHAPKYPATDGTVNLTRTIKVTDTGYELYGYKGTGGTNTFWGTIDAQNANLTVKDVDDNVFTISKEGDTYKLNGTIIEVAPPAPEVNTDASFMGTPVEKHEYVMSIFEEVMNSDGLDSLTPNPDGDGWLLEGYKTTNYAVWGVVTVNDSGYPTTLDVVVQNSNDDVFEVTMENGTFYLNGVECKEKEETPLQPPVEPTESYIYSGIPITSEEREIYGALSTAFLSPGYPMQALFTNITNLDKTVGNYHLKISNGVARYEVIKDFKLTELGEDVTVKVGSYTESYMSDGSSIVEIRFIFNDVEYTLTQERYGSGVVKSGETVIEDHSIVALASQINDMVSMEAANLIFAPAVIGDFLNKDLPLDQTMIMNISSFSFGIGTGESGAANIDMNYLVSVKELQISDYNNTKTYMLSSPGLRVTMDVESFVTTGTMTIRGPVTIDNTSYYLDVTQIEADMSGGIRVDGVWKSISRT